jgi:hypothetical protein
MPEQVHPSHVLSDKLFKRLKSLKHNNYHGEAYQEAAHALGLTELEAEFTRINQIHARAGELSYELNQTRYAAYQQLIQKSKSMLSAEQAKKLHMCF